MRKVSRSLAADREIASAMDAAPFVIANLDAQIGAFRSVLGTMRTGLERLDAEQRDQVEQASAVLRKVRAGARLPLEDITRRLGNSVTQDVKRKPADVLREARRRDSDRKRDQVFRAVDAMKRHGIPITFASVARSAKVSQWLVYADGVREYVLSAREAQAAEPVNARHRGREASEASLRTDLELAKRDNRRLRAEVDRLKSVLREQLGTQLEAACSQTIRTALALALALVFVSYLLAIAPSFPQWKVRTKPSETLQSDGG